MMRKSFAGCVLVALSLSGCSVPPPATLSSTFSPAEVAWAAQSGSNTIIGNAVLRTVGGDVKTCAGFEAGLIPVSAYSTEIMTMAFRSPTSGYASYLPNVTLDPAYKAANRTTVCDSQGNFSFTNIPDGDYFVVTKVTWGAVQGGRYAYVATQGGFMMQRVSVTGGQTKSIVLTS